MSRSFGAGGGLGCQQFADSVTLAASAWDQRVKEDSRAAKRHERGRDGGGAVEDGDEVCHEPGVPAKRGLEGR